jgi:hypothetical protein
MVSCYFLVLGCRATWVTVILIPGFGEFNSRLGRPEFPVRAASGIIVKGLISLIIYAEESR